MTEDEDRQAWIDTLKAKYGIRTIGSDKEEPSRLPEWPVLEEGATYRCVGEYAMASYDGVHFYVKPEDMSTEEFLSSLRLYSRTAATVALTCADLRSTPLSFTVRGVPRAADEVNGTLRDRLRDEIAQALALAAQLQAVTHLKASHDKGPLRGKVSHGSIPWEGSAEWPLLDLHASSRDTEHDLRYFLGLPARPRGGSDGNTRKALEYIASSASSADDHLVERQVRWIRRWNNQAAGALGQIELPRRLPRIPGQSEARCPWCQNDTLRQRPLEGIVFCLLVDCRDEEGRRPRGQLEFFNGEWVLRWQDMIIGAPS